MLCVPFPSPLTRYPSFRTNVYLASLCLMLFAPSSFIIRPGSFSSSLTNHHFETPNPKLTAGTRLRAGPALRGVLRATGEGEGATGG